MSERNFLSITTHPVAKQANRFPTVYVLAIGYVIADRAMHAWFARQLEHGCWENETHAGRDYIVRCSVSGNRCFPFAILSSNFRRPFAESYPHKEFLDKRRNRDILEDNKNRAQLRRGLVDVNVRLAGRFILNLEFATIKLAGWFLINRRAAFLRK